MRSLTRHTPIGLPRASRHQGRAFTLVELLVVVSVISLLVAISAPTISRSRDLAKGSLCAKQMRSFGVASHLHVVKRGCYPHMGTVWDRGWPKIYGLLEMMKIPPSHETHGLWSYENLLPEEIWAGALGVRTRKVTLNPE